MSQGNPEQLPANQEAPAGFVTQARDRGMPLDAVQSLPPSIMLLKMENEQIFSVARAEPRDPVKIVEQLRALIDAYPAAAEEAVYSKPVGTVTEVTCPHCAIKFEVNLLTRETVCPACDKSPVGVKDLQTRKVKKYAEGLSIRAAESIRSIYGYTRLAITMEQGERGQVKITGTLVDYSAGNLTSDERIVSPWYKSRGGGMVQTPEDRFLNVVVKSEKAKLRRDLILDNTPGIVRALFRDACDQKMLDLVSPEEIQQKVVPAFAPYGINTEQLDLIVGSPAKLGWTEQERLRLRKILTALKSGETTARDLLDGLASVVGEPGGTELQPVEAAKEKMRTQQAEASKPPAAALPVAPPPPGAYSPAAPGSEPQVSPDQPTSTPPPATPTPVVKPQSAPAVPAQPQPPVQEPPPAEPEPEPPATPAPIEGQSEATKVGPSNELVRLVTRYSNEAQSSESLTGLRELKKKVNANETLLSSPDGLSQVLKEITKMEEKIKASRPVRSTGG